MAKNPWRPLKFETPQEITDKGMVYINYQKENKLPLTVTGLCIALHTYRDVLMDYQDERGEDFSNAVKDLKLQCENYAEEQAFIGKNPAGAIFVLKNHKWTDKTEQELYGKGGTPLIPRPIDDILPNASVQKDQSNDSEN